MTEISAVPAYNPKRTLTPRIRAAANRFMGILVTRVGARSAFVPLPV